MAMYRNIYRYEQMHGLVYTHIYFLYQLERHRCNAMLPAINESVA